MATFDNKEILDALSAPVGDLIAAVGRGVADAQRQLDIASLTALREVYESNEDFYRELQRIGYRPTWYHIPEAEGEIQVAISMSSPSFATNNAKTSPGGAPVQRRAKMYAAPVDAGYSSRFDFKLEASSKLKFRVVPIPASAPVEATRVVPALVGLTVGVAEERLRLLGIDRQIPVNAQGSDVISMQEPSPGSVLEPEQSVSLDVS